jgi:hypothetical protein
LNGPNNVRLSVRFEAAAIADAELRAIQLAYNKVARYPGYPMPNEIWLPFEGGAFAGTMAAQSYGVRSASYFYKLESQSHDFFAEVRLTKEQNTLSAVDDIEACLKQILKSVRFEESMDKAKADALIRARGRELRYQSTWGGWYLPNRIAAQPTLPERGPVVAELYTELNGAKIRVRVTDIGSGVSILAPGVYVWRPQESEWELIYKGETIGFYRGFGGTLKLEDPRTLVYQEPTEKGLVTRKVRLEYPDP